MPHLRRWRRLTIHGPCEYDGEIIQRQRSGFESAKERAGLGADVTPHTLKHTCITWLLQKGVPTWQVAGFTGTSEGLITRVYGHHSPNYMEEARSAIGRR
jgi:integrase